MKNKISLKHIFYFSSALLLIIMLFLSKNAGISCDEVLHYNQSVSVYNYFASHGANRSALITPVSSLKYYGQSYDNIATILTRWFNIDDIYGFRHILSIMAGWLAIFVTALFAVWLADYRTGIFVLILFAISPTFMGHAQNNLKDIPFAMGYIASIFFMTKFLFSGKRTQWNTMIYLTLSIAFTISIRVGGLLLLCYLFLFFLIYYLFKYLKDNKFELKEFTTKLLWISGITVVSWFLSILLWPYALQRPISNVLDSFRVMAHYPSSFQQIFEGKVEWSDFMQWYYIPKSMLITIPLVVISGFVIFFIFIRKFKGEKGLQYAMIFFTILFPVVFVAYEKSNVYSSWRQFLFLYPGIILLAAIGFSHLFEYIRNRYVKYGGIILLGLLSLHPLRFMKNNPMFYYIYYNQLTGGLKGAYSNFETDYYFVGQTAASEWLTDYLKNKSSDSTIKVNANYTVEWQFRKFPKIETSYSRFEERSFSDWDYSIVTNRYISPFKLRNKLWPPRNAIHNIYADGVPVCSVIKRRTKDDYAGYLALNQGKNREAIAYFEKALKIDADDEMIFYNFATALYDDGQYQKADSILHKGLEINPDFELILMYLGNIARTNHRTDEAIGFYERVIKADRKYFEAYVGIAELITEKDVIKARSLLKTCLDMDPEYKPAIVAMAGTYRKSDPDIAKKYDELAGRIK